MSRSEVVTSRARQPSRDLAVAAELALAGVTVAAVLGMQPLFLDGAFIAPLLLQAGLAFVTIAGLRRANMSLGVAALLTLMTATVAITWSQYADTLWVVLPSLDTWTATQADMAEAWSVFREVRAPAPVEPGFVVSASMAIWVAVFTADWGAFRTGVSFESLLPSATLFLFAAVLGDEASAGWGASAYAATALLFLLLHRTWRQESAAPWATPQRRRGRRSLLLPGAALAGTAVVVSAFTWPHLPGASDPPVVPWRDTGDEDETRRVVSPLVDVRGRLVERSNLEMFTVETDGDATGHYWRLTALDEFTGDIWRSSYRTDPAAGQLPRSAESAATTRQIVQTISVTNLEAIWLPAAYEPVAFESDEETPVEYDPRSSTLIVAKSVDSSDGLAYRVVSDVPRWTPEQLRGAATASSDVLERYLQLPDDFSEEVAAEAARITTDADTDYDKAIALQSYLRTFDYTLDPPLPETRSQHSQDALEWFLLEIQRGYCEQFSGAFAAMARSLGIPTRVAVGFTMGVQDPHEPTLYRVQGKHAHAWPEAYFEGYGWVPFEPTPGRGIPGGEAWSGIPGEQVDEHGDGTSATTLPGGPEPGVPEVGPGGDEIDDANASPPPSAPESSGNSEDGDQTGLFEGMLPSQVISTGRTVGVGALGYLLLVPAGLVLQQHLRRRRARAPAQQVQQAWEETLDQARLLQVQIAPSMTVGERADRLRASLPEAAPAIDGMATSVELSLYAGAAPTAREAGLAQLAASAIRSHVAKRRPWYRRALDYLDARRLLPKSNRVRRSAHSTQRTQPPVA